VITEILTLLECKQCPHNTQNYLILTDRVPFLVLWYARPRINAKKNLKFNTKTDQRTTTVSAPETGIAVL